MTLKIEGVGLISGAPTRVEIELAEPGHGIVFYRDGLVPIPAKLANVVHTDRGVTLAIPTETGAPMALSIVEHFLCACSMAGLTDLKVSQYGAPELPLLDGSALPWLEKLRAEFSPQNAQPIPLSQAVFHREDDETCVYALPSTHFQITYAVNFDHPDLKNRWVRWDSATDDVTLIAASQTFGYVRELPILQAQGLAKGVTPQNTLGLTDDGGYTRPLRHPDEPIYHKMIDLIGDLTLTGLNPMALQAHVVAIQAGHTSHVAFAKKIVHVLSPNEETAPLEPQHA